MAHPLPGDAPAANLSALRPLGSPQRQLGRRPSGLWGLPLGRRGEALPARRSWGASAPALAPPRRA
eukprot:7785829-Alexandrium_andersonii.AAC.1